MATADNEPTSLLGWRRDALQVLLRYLVWFGLPGLIFHSSMLIQKDHVALVMINVFAYLVLVVGYVRRDWHIRWHSTTVIGVVYTFSLSTLIDSGLTGVGPVCLLACSVLGALLLERRLAIGFWVLSMLTLLLALGASLAGYYLGELDRLTYQSNFAQFLLICLTTVFLNNVLTLVVFALTNQLQSSLRLAETALVVRQTMQSNLEQRVSERTAELHEALHTLRESEIDHRLLAMEHARLYDSARRQAEQIETLRQASVAVAATLDAETAINQILEQLVHVIPHDSASVQLRRDDFTEVFGCRGFDNPQDILGLRFSISGNVLHEAVYLRGEAQLVTQTHGHPGFIGLTNQVINAWLGLPLLVHDQVIGMLTLDSAQTGIFTEEHLRIGSLFAGQVAIALDHTQRFQREVRAHQRLTVLQQAVHEIAAQSTAPSEIYATIHQAARKLMPADSFLITLIDPTRDEIEHVYMFDRGRVFPSQSKPLRGSFTDYMIRRNSALLINDFEQVEGYSFSQFGEDEESQSGVAVLLRGRTRILGTIFTQSYQPAAYSEDDPALLELLAAHVATALENANLFAEVERLATVDALTELPNRRSFFTRAAQEFARARRTEQPISIIMLDVDHFKHVNDTYGHHIGDQTLRAVAAITKAWLRPSDVIGRYGGEEIAIVLPETNLAGAAKVAERIRREIDAIEVTTPNGIVHVTASLGVASSAAPSAADLSALLIQADAAMYDAKQNGRNRVCGGITNQE